MTKVDRTYDSAIRKLQALHTRSKGSLVYKAAIKACIRELQDSNSAPPVRKENNG